MQLGHYYARTKFGCITRCDSADFNGVDGILGIGMPDAGCAHAMLVVPMYRHYWMALDLFERKSIAGPARDRLCLADMESHDQRWRPSRSAPLSRARQLVEASAAGELHPAGLA